MASGPHGAGNTRRPAIDTPPSETQAHAQAPTPTGSPAGKAEAGGLRRELSPLAVLLLTLSCLSPALSIYGAGSDVLIHAGTGAVLLFMVGIGAALVWAAVYAELAAAYPYAGGDYVGVGRVLGPWAGFASLTVWAFNAGPATAFTAHSVATYAAEAFPGVPADAAVYGALGLSLLAALLTVRMSAFITGIFLALEMLAVFILLAAGASHPVREVGAVLSAPLMPGPGGGLVAVSLAAMAVNGIGAAYATIGGNQAIGFGEELRDPHRRMGPVILVAALIGAITTALPVIFVALAAADLPALLASPAPFTTFMAQVTGAPLARALSLAVALAILNANIAQIMFYGRLFYSMGRDEIFPHGAVNRALASVHGPSGAPRVATLVAGVVALLCCLLPAHVLLVVIAGTTAPTFYLVSAAVWSGRRRGLTGAGICWRAPAYPLAPLLGFVLSTAFLAGAWFDEDAGRPSLYLLGFVLVLAMAWYHLHLKRRPGGWSPRITGEEGRS
jgi:amino acid transporter